MKKISTIIITLFCLILLNTNVVFAYEDCSLGGTNIKHGNSIKTFSSKTSNNCNGITKTRFCNNGNLSGSNDYKYTSCNESNYLPSVNNVDVGSISSSNNIDNNLLDDLKDPNDIKVGDKGEKSIIDLLYTIAKDIKTIFYILSGLFLLILIIKLIFSDKTDEEVGNFKKGITWISFGIVVTQISFYFVNILYAKEVGGALAYSLSSNLINPIIRFLETAASFIFLAIAIYAFYTLITANGNEEKTKSGKMSIVYGLLGFIVIKIAKDLVYATYGKVDCKNTSFLNIFTINGNNCTTENELSKVSETIVNIINWMNGFIGIIIIIIIIYAGIQVIFGAGNDDKLTSAKKSILYIIIGLAILILNYFILTFLILPETTI